jgi:hypothetical protein
MIVAYMHQIVYEILYENPSSVFTGPGVDQSGLDRSGFSPVRSKDFSDWNRTSLKFHRTGLDSVWTGPGLHCRVRFILAEIGLGLG